MDAAAFANLMSEYGATWFGYGAPVIIAVEIVLAILLIFNVSPRPVTVVATGFVVVVSVIYLYGIRYKGITNCGCFGPLTFLNSKPWITFVRNSIIIAMLVPSVVKQQSSSELSMHMLVFISIVAAIILFMCGYSFRGAKCLQREHVFQRVAVSDSPLASVITTNADSSYLVFAFSYNCPFCLNAIGNVNQYTQMHAVDKVIGLAVNDTAMEARFHRLFETNFEIQNLSPYTMYKIASTLPVAYLIRRDTIVRQYDGVVVSPALFMK